MNISLGSQWEAFINKNIKTGRYLSASEVVRDGLRLLQEREQLRQAKLDDLRRQVDEGFDALDRGEGLALDEAGMKKFMKDVSKRGRERLARRRTPAQ